MSNKSAKKLLVMHLVGGIGNQLFVYYAGRVLANQTNRNLSLDFSDVNRGHNMEDISNLRISCQSETSTVKRILKRFSLINYFNALNYKCEIPKILKGSLLFPIMEAEIDQLGKFRKRSRIHVAGYFQTNKYYDLYQQSHPGSNLLFYESEFSLDMDCFNWDRTLGVHVRRGDYLAHRYSFGVLSAEWYRDAIKVALKSLGQKIDHIVFFTNDYEWVSKHLQPMIDTARYSVSVEKNSETTSVTVVLKELARCKGLVISNSTFSLMGAYHSTAMVFTPETFFRNQESFLLKDVRENWLKIKSRWEE